MTGGENQKKNPAAYMGKYIGGNEVCSHVAHGNQSPANSTQAQSFAIPAVPAFPFLPEMMPSLSIYVE